MVGENPTRPRPRASPCVRTRIVGAGRLRRARRGRRRLPVARLRQHVRRGDVGRTRLHRPGDRHRRPALRVGVLLAALFFGFATALQFHFQALGLHVPFQFFLILPVRADAARAGRRRRPRHRTRRARPALRARLVWCPRSSLPISASNRRYWQGAPTQEYREYSEEAQRRQERRGPAKLVANFGDGALQVTRPAPRREGIES